MAKRIVVGITGSFGSGCSTLAEVLQDFYECKLYSLSRTLREEWDATHPAKPSSKALKKDLQLFGNELRQKSVSILAEKTVKKVKEDRNTTKNLVFDSIRNPAEIAYIRNRFPETNIVAVDCVEGDRWERVGKKDFLDKGLKYENFLEDNSRDKNEEGLIYGQQVALCVDEADYLIRNDNEPMVASTTAIRRKLKGKLEDPINLFRGLQRLPNKEEVCMGIAYSASLMSQCIKRQVGAVILDKKGKVVSVGFNSNPPPLEPCHKQFGDCYREITVEKIMNSLKYCPFCQEELNGLKYPYDCPKCKENIYRKIMKDRAMSRCNALHAEEMAIANAHQNNIVDCSIYVTTFPCFHCAQAILNVGIREICYVESYPDVDSINLLRTAQNMGRKIVIRKFEGVKAYAYFKFFRSWRRQKELELLETRRKNV